MVNADSASDTRNKMQALQRALYRAAKASTTRRFHAVYDKVFREDILAYAWQEVRANRGKPGIDGQSISEIERSGVDPFLEELARELHPGKKGYMDPTLDSIFVRLKIDREKWLDAIKNYDKWFYRIIGKMSAAWETLKDTTNQWFKGSKANRHLFGD